MSAPTVSLCGNLGQDPEVHRTDSVTICKLRVACNYRRKERGEWVDAVEWVRVVTFGKTAENCERYLAKGRQVYVVGSMQTSKWQDKDGNDRYTTEVVANSVDFVGGRGDGGESRQRDGGYGNSGGYGGGTGGDDSIPFAPMVLV